MKSLAIFLSYHGFIIEQAGSPQQKIIKIESIAYQEQLLVAGENTLYYFISIILVHKLIRQQ